MKKFKYELPSLMSTTLLGDLTLAAEDFVMLFSTQVKPAIRKFGLLDVDHVKKYLGCADMRPIYEDAVAKDELRVRLLEDFEISHNTDFWEPFRAENCKAQTPRDEGFEFKPMPLANDPAWMREKVLRVIKVSEDCALSIDEQILPQECLIHPTDRKRQLFDLVSEFCAEFNKQKFKGRNNYRLLFTYDKDGNLAPNASGILFGSIGMH